MTWTISQRKADQIERKLKKRLQAFDVVVETEIQDVGEFLLVQLKPLNLEPSNKVLLDIARELLSAQIAPRKSNHSWMAVVVRNGKVVDVVNAEMR